jgi:hypothetical protein
LSNKQVQAQKVMVKAINECLRQGIFTLDPNDTELSKPVHEFDMEGIPAIAGVHDAGHGELSIKVALWPTEHGKEFANVAALNSGQRLMRGGFFVSGWLERKNGAWLQTSEGLQVSCAKTRRDEVDAIAWEAPNGFEAEGKFFM